MINNELMALRGDRNKWLDFTNKVRKNKQKVWNILEKFIDDYMSNNN
jgi:hypothetical protein